MSVWVVELSFQMVVRLQALENDVFPATFPSRLSSQPPSKSHTKEFHFMTRVQPKTPTQILLKSVLMFAVVALSFSPNTIFRPRTKSRVHVANAPVVSIFPRAD